MRKHSLLGVAVDGVSVGIIVSATVGVAKLLQQKRGTRCGSYTDVDLDKEVVPADNN